MSFNPAGGWSPDKLCLRATHKHLEVDLRRRSRESGFLPSIHSALGTGVGSACLISLPGASPDRLCHLGLQLPRL